MPLKDPKARNAYHKNRRAEARQKVLEFLGCICIHCGFSDTRALQIDHVNGGGTKEWNRGALAYDRKYEMVYATPQNYQILCANCNWIKRHENDEFPKTGRPKKR